MSGTKKWVVALVFCCALAPAAFASRRAEQCPAVSVSCPEGFVASGAPVSLSASVTGGDPAVKYTFFWVVSAGVITGGQRAASIMLDTTGVVMPIEATVEVGGLPEPCARKASCSFQAGYLCILPRKVDVYGDISVGDEKARLDNFLAELQSDPATVGYIVVYDGRRSRAGLTRARANRARNFLIVSRGMEPERLVWMDGGHREDLTTELYVLPRDAPAPIPSPTVDPSEVRHATNARPGKGKRPAPRKRS